MNAFVERRAAIGRDDFLPFEMAVVRHAGATLVVLRDMRGEPRTPVLAACFEHIATVLRVELLHLRRLPQPLHFFHCRYELAAGSDVRWVVREVAMRLEGGCYSLAQWRMPDAPVLEQLSASLNLSESPARLR